LPFSPPDAKKRDPSAANAIPMNVALTSIHVIIKDGRIFKNLLN